MNYLNVRSYRRLPLETRKQVDAWLDGRPADETVLVVPQRPLPDCAWSRRSGPGRGGV